MYLIAVPQTRQAGHFSTARNPIDSDAMNVVER
jgi:hypothetical protein